MVFKPEHSWEFLSHDEIIARSIRAVRNHVKHLKEVSPYYAEVLSAIEPGDITSPETIAALPLTDKATLVDRIDRFMAVPEQQVAETVITSGSTGKPLVFSMTRNDLDRLAFNEALSFHAMGVTKQDRAQIMVSLDRLFIAGMAYYRGLTTLGVNTCRIGVLPFDMQKHYLELLRPTVIVGVPSYLLKFGQQIKNVGSDTRSCSVQKIVCIGESLRNESLALNGVGTKLMELFGASVYSTYGNTELSIAYCECLEQKGNHAHPELIYTEIVDEKGHPVPDGAVGELVGTPLGVEGVPLLRYRTGDITFKVPGSCACGRNSDRIGPILARKSQMIKLKGTTIYPLTLINALDELEYVEDYIIVLEGSESLSDNVTLHVVSHPSRVSSISGHLQAKARVSIPVLISNQTTINSYRGASSKKVRIIDKRAFGKKSV